MQTLDSSIIQTQNYTDKSFLDEITQKTQDILSRTFPESAQKQQIKRDATGLNIACPYCHDSATNSWKKRGHIMFSGKFSGYYKCFNCGAFTPIPKFFNDFKTDLSLSGIKYVEDHKENIEAFQQTSSEITADIFQKTIALRWALDRDKFRDYFHLCDISSSYYCKEAYDYLVGRCQYKFKNFLYNPKARLLYILNMVESKIIGFQLRSIDKHTKKDRRFLTYNLERIYKNLLNQTCEIPQDLNTVSTVFDIYNINVYKPIIVTEGPMDSFLLPNAVASAGANKTLTVELPFWYMYDSDKTGMSHALKKLNERKKVFLWGKLKKDLNLPKRDKWDVNDVVLYCTQTYGRDFQIDWLKYFSDNPLDMMFLDSIAGNL